MPEDAVPTNAILLTVTKEAIQHKDRLWVLTVDTMGMPVILQLPKSAFTNAPTPKVWPLYTLA